MHLDRSFKFTSLLFATLAGFSGAALAHPAGGAQVCTLASAAAGQPGTLICKSTLTGATTQSIAIGNTVLGSGGIGGALSRRGDSVLVTDIAGGAVLLEESHGRLGHRVPLNTGGEDSLPAGTIVGITGLDDLVVAPVAHLASNASQAIVPVASGDTRSCCGAECPGEAGKAALRHGS